MIIVVVKLPPDREIFVNGDYDEPRARSQEDIVLKPGTHKFETLTQDGSVDFRQRLVDVPDFTLRLITLDPVVPPEPTV